jgi:alkyl sulfatase BDS1-like metallo-beta-lactamase superfamily hydrolase
VPTNRLRTSGEIAPMYGRGLVQQFGIRLEAGGPDGLLSVGLGKFFRNPAHAPFTPGYLDPTETFVEPTVATIAGLRVEFTPAPSDADDSVNIWFPELNVCVHNIVWPTLFNVFAIRGEEYRDPRVLLTGLDHLRGLKPEHLVGAHGPPLSGGAQIREIVTDYRDSIQFLWDQTVRGLNKGLTADALTEFVQMPERFSRTYLTRQWYGVAEHHVRQIQTGLIGFFDGDEAALFPLPEQERAERLIAGFGGRDEVRKQSIAAVAANDLRWALELATWLVRSERNSAGRADGGSPEDREQLAAVLRTIGQRSTAMNIRNWCLTRALELEGKIELERLRTHQFRAAEVATRPEAAVRTLRVLLDPHLAEDFDQEIRFEFTGGPASSGVPASTAGLRIRKGVAVPTDGADADVVLRLTPPIWGKILSGKAHVCDCVASGEVEVREGSLDVALALLGCFDLPTLASETGPKVGA